VLFFLSHVVVAECCFLCGFLFGSRLKKLSLKARVVGLFPFFMALHSNTRESGLLLLDGVYSPKMKGAN